MPHETNVRISRDATSVTALVTRVIGAPVPVRLSWIDAPQRQFVVSARGDDLQISATDTLAACVAVHRYLQDGCGLRVTWDTELPLALAELPSLPEVSGRAVVPDISYLNFCAYSYTLPFWDWEQWQREIDWMALHGISQPLTLVGHEAVLLEAYGRLGVPADVVLAHLGGPAFLPFHYMGCLEGHDGPLSRAWVEDHLVLARQVLQRQRSLGMTPVLPTFVGVAPETFGAQDRRHREWEGFATSVLRPSDPSYRTVIRTITEVQHELLGTDHLYAADPFIEMAPVEAEPDYPAQVAQATVEGLVDADPEATWVMQAWPFSFHPDFWTDRRVAEFLRAVPDERLLLLDLWGEQRPQWRLHDAFRGKDWTWCALVNFGGRTDLAGDLDAVGREARAALDASDPPVGLGLSMEGIDVTPELFENALDQVWNPPVDQGDWLREFGKQRYGLPEVDLGRVWSDLAATFLSHPEGRLSGADGWGGLTKRPTYALLEEPAEPLLWFDPSRAMRAWSELGQSAASVTPGASSALSRDLVGVTAAVVQRVIEHRTWAVARRAALGAVDRAACAELLDLIARLDEVLAGHPRTRWETWERQARRWDEKHGTVTAVRSARRLLTTWAEQPGTALDDYARRCWSGLVMHYYRPRWLAWTAHLPDAAAGDRDQAQGALDLDLAQLAKQFLATGVPASPQPSPTHTVAACAALRRDLADEFASLPWHPEEIR